MTDQQLTAAAARLSQQLLDSRNAQGWWTGCLSTSALSTATATLALWKAAQADDVPPAAAEQWRQLVSGGLQWLLAHQNPDGGWGDTVLSISNISTTMLAHAVLMATRSVHADHPQAAQFAQALQRSQQYVEHTGGVTAVLQRYGSDRTFSVPILTHCALAGLVDWKHVIPLPFELACVPARLYAAVRMPVVSYALPALIAIGQVIFHHQGHRNPVVRLLRQAAIQPSLKVLESIQPPHGGFLEATPLTSFVCMSLIGCGLQTHPVTQRCLQFIVSSVRDDGSWPIDTNLTTWVTTLSVNALAASNPPAGHGAPSGPAAALADQPALPQSACDTIRHWLLQQQYQTVHPYTNAAPGGWSWTDLPGGVPDADDTPGAILAVLNLRSVDERLTETEQRALRNAVVWLLDLQNRDGGWPTFCRGWGTLPFDRSSSDLTAHALRAIRCWQARCPGESAVLRQRAAAAVQRGLRFVQQAQRPDGTWLPLWFGNQFNTDDENPLYGTAKVLLALEASEPGTAAAACAHRAVRWLLENQNSDGGWSARRGLVSSVEETGLAVEALAAPALHELPGVAMAARRGAQWLATRVHSGEVAHPSPIGFYFAKLWYFEQLYPLIFAAAGLNRWAQTNCAAQRIAKGSS